MKAALSAIGAGFAFDTEAGRGSFEFGVVKEGILVLALLGAAGVGGLVLCAC